MEPPTTTKEAERARETGLEPEMTRDVFWRLMGLCLEELQTMASELHILGMYREWVEDG